MAAPLSRACLRGIRHMKLKNGSILNKFGYKTAGIHFTAIRNNPPTEEEDFYGIREDQDEKNRTESGLEESDGKARELERQKLLRSLQKKAPNRELVAQTGYGQVRLDGKTKNSLQDVEPQQFLRALSKTASGETVNRDHKMAQRPTSDLGGKKSQRRKTGHMSEKQRHAEKKDSDECSSSRRPAMNYFDGQYFGSVSQTFLSAAADGTVSDQRGQPVMSPHGEPIPTVEDSRNITTSTQLTGEEITSTDSRHDTNITHSTPVRDLQHQVHNFIDEAYFPELTTDSSSTETVDHNSIHDRRDSDFKENCQTSTSHSFIDDQYFSPQFSSYVSSETIQPGEDVSQVKTVQNRFSDEQLCEKSQTEILDFDDKGTEHSDGAYEDHKHLLENVPTASTARQPSQTVRTVSQVRAGTEQPAAKNKFSFIDEQYFESQSGVPQSSLENTAMQYGISGEKAAGELTAPHRNENQTGTSLDYKQTEDIHDHSPQFSGRRRKVSSSESVVREVEDSAYTAAMKLRRNLRLNLDSKEEEGKEQGIKRENRVQTFKDQVPDLEHMPAMEVTQLLADSLLFENDDFIAVNKPYGLPSHGGPGVRVSVGQVLEPLSRRLDAGRHRLENLHLVHRLDKETTGVMLLAKNAEVAWQLLGMFRRREVGKTYWTVTKGLPQPHEGVIEIPLARQKVNGVYKTVVMPKQYVSEDKIKAQTWNRRGDKSMAAVTEYKVLAHRDSMALVECRPLTGVQHQIRAHLAQALNTPVLGDHKYSHMDRLAPQKLFPEALQKLGLRQAQVRHIPMHLHAKGLLLPEWRGRTNFFIAAPIPKFFLRNLKSLKVKIPPQ